LTGQRNNENSVRQPATCLVWLSMVAKIFAPVARYPGEPAMRLRVLDLDGSLPVQADLMARFRPAVFAAREWGPSVRLACSFGRFRRFEQKLAALFQTTSETEPTLTFYGSGDFHHLSLALVRRLRVPIN